MKKILLITLILLFTGGLAMAKGYEITKKAGTYDVTLNIDKNPPVVGDNNFSVTVKDSAGKAVTDAAVAVDYSMPAMPGMPPMNYKTGAALKSDEYTGKINLSMSGAWNIAVKVTRAGATFAARFNVEAH